jgi:hypothetical protein
MSFYSFPVKDIKKQPFDMKANTEGKVRTIKGKSFNSMLTMTSPLRLPLLSMWRVGVASHLNMQVWKSYTKTTSHKAL